MALRLRPLVTAAAAAVCAVLALSVLPHPAERSGELAVFRTQPVRALGTDNLVDTLQPLPLSNRLRRVEWRSGALTVDLEVSAAARDARTLLGDLDLLAALAFRQVGNAERLLVRFVGPGPEGAGSRSLLLAADIRKGDRWLRETRGLPPGREALDDPRWRSRLRLTTGRAWDAQFGAGEPS